MTVAEGALILELSSPDSDPFDLRVDEIVVPGAAGIFTVLPGHTPMLTTLTQGVVIAYSAQGDRSFFAVHCGFAEVFNDRVVILADTMEHQNEIDRERAEAARDRARDRLAKREPTTSNVRAEAALARARARLQAHHGEEY